MTELPIDALVELTEEHQYAAFNDRTVLEPLFASGKIPEAMRFVIDDPLYTGTLWSVSRWARLTNEERALGGQLDQSGPVVIMKRTVTTTPWEVVSYDEINEALL